MTRSTKHVGLDVHQATTVTSVREDSGRVIARSVVPTAQDDKVPDGAGWPRSGRPRFLACGA